MTGCTRKFGVLCNYIHSDVRWCDPHAQCQSDYAVVGCLHDAIVARREKKGVRRACAKGHSNRSNCFYRKLPPPACPGTACMCSILHGIIWHMHLCSMHISKINDKSVLYIYKYDPPAKNLPKADVDAVSNSFFHHAKHHLKNNFKRIPLQMSQN